jgi:hypothetical protein
MATFTFPYWAQPVLEFYNLKWPDVDEDAIAELGHHIQQVANDTWLFGVAVKAALSDLSESSDSAALSALVDDFSEFVTGPLQTITTEVGDAAVSSTLAVANGITTYKAGVLGVLTLNVGSDIALICTGVGAAAVIAKKALMREVLELALDEAARQAAAWLVGQWNAAVDEHIVGPLETFVASIGRDLGGSARRIAVMSVPTHAAAAPLAALYIDHHDIVHAVAKVKAAYDRLAASVGQLRSWTAGSGYDSPTPVPDPTVRIALKEALSWAGDAFMGEIDQIGSDIVNNIVDIVTDTYDKYMAADVELGALAEQLRDQFSLPVPTSPYVADRSTRPKPMVVLDAPPPIMTGPAQSGASKTIATTVLPDDPEPVVTGPAQSDARSSVRQIVLGEDPDPVQTGPAQSTARDAIRQA